MDLKEIGERIQKLRLNTNTTKKSLSEFLDISETDLERIETGTTNLINSDIIEKLSNLYYIPISYILNGENTIENRIYFNYEGCSAKELKNMATIFSIIKNQIKMDRML